MISASLEYLWDEEVSALEDDYRAFPTHSANPSIFGSPTASPQQQRRNLPSLSTRPPPDPDTTDDDDVPLINPSADLPPTIVVETDQMSVTSDRYGNATFILLCSRAPFHSLDGERTTQKSRMSTRPEPGTPRRNAPSRASVDSVYTVDSGTPCILTADDIMLCYWRINSRLRASSLALQRWLVAWVAFILIWSCTFLVWWINNEATLLSIAQFVFPILLLPVVCSVYGEVNLEGRRMLKCICPNEERVYMMLLLNRQPLEMTAFGYPVNYSVIVTFIGAVLVAFCTKIILERV
ncbi:hypothetical protein CAPTEDRAFT_202268 [Capitella teleta]|uniref:Transmembrane protein n=1 Tax=Capitella teleta TaxID=283909 RepID=R7TA83_CAPTE|nr:hypothetical protein CAPTEDRAFT_202268 [Capitella teleta]|eukprot:ELT90392.1 hypothetical protein CAPTEDRAFT_202268 [Capitella teleta]